MARVLVQYSTTNALLHDIQCTHNYILGLVLSHTCIYMYLFAAKVCIHSLVSIILCVVLRWDVLNVAAGYSANETVSDPYLMLCAGYLEGALTQQ